MKEIKRGDIYLVDLGDNIGSVQKGERPAIVVQNDKGNKYSPTITVIPITTKIHRSKGFPTHVLLDHMGGLDEESASMAEQITTISRNSFKKYIGHLNNKTALEGIEQSICIQLGLNLSKNGTYFPKPKSQKNQGLSPCANFENGTSIGTGSSIPIWHKASLTVEEAAEYSNIGVNRLRELCKEPTNNFCFFIGRKILIKREAFDEYLRKTTAL